MSNFSQDNISNISTLKTSSYQKKYIENLPNSLKHHSGSLFSEIMKNYSNSPEILPEEGKKDRKNVVKLFDIPLPETSTERSTAPKSSRKRHMKSIKEESIKRIRSDSNLVLHSSIRSLPLPAVPLNINPHVKHEKKEKEIIFKKPKICESRSKIKNNINAERSVKSFKIIAEVGEGTYGHVFKAIDRKTNELKALKKIRLENEREGFPITTVREIKILHKLNHPNIIHLNEVVTDYDWKSSNSNTVKAFYLVFEYMDHDLYGILDSGITLSEDQIASIMKQIISGICYCHKRKFLHRDIKSSNILVNNRGEVKIADFGLARRFEADNTKRPYTNKVITLWYRAPELLLGEEIYGEAIDVWSIGCIMGELFVRRTMFTASNEMDQLETISKICGTPNAGVWPNVTKLPLFSTFRPKSNYKRRLREYYCTLPHSALEVLDWMLQLDPKRRCSTEQALNSYWLRKIDPKQIPPPAFPADKDYHELSCKRRHRQNHSDTTTATCYKSNIKPQKSSSSNNSVDEPIRKQKINTIGYEPSAQSEMSFEISDLDLKELKIKLGNILPSTVKLDDLLNSSKASLSENDFEGTLKKLLEPYIKEIISDKISQNTFAFSSDNNNSQYQHSSMSFDFMTEDSNDSCRSINPKTQSKNSCKYV